MRLSRTILVTAQRVLAGSSACFSCLARKLFGLGRLKANPLDGRDGEPSQASARDPNEALVILETNSNGSILFCAFDSTMLSCAKERRPFSLAVATHLRTVGLKPSIKAHKGSAPKQQQQPNYWLAVTAESEQPTATNSEH